MIKCNVLFLSLTETVSFSLALNRNKNVGNIHRLHVLLVHTVLHNFQNTTIHLRKYIELLFKTTTPQHVFAVLQFLNGGGTRNGF